MDNNNDFWSDIGDFDEALGKGLIAGLAGTAAITLSQAIERKVTRKATNFAPGDVASNALDINGAKLILPCSRFIM